MIKSILRLTEFGIFKDFDWNNQTLDDFNKYNLFYGWNYSGKTTLSRLFSQIQYPEKPSAYASSSFKVLLDNGNSIDSASLSGAPKVRVFNRDFVVSNFQQEHKAPAIYVVGEENIKARSRLDTLETRSMRLSNYLQTQESIQTKLQSSLASNASRRATEIGQLLGVRDFRKPDLERLCMEVKTDLVRFTLSDAEISNCLAILRSANQHHPLTPLSMQSAELKSIADEVNFLLKETASNRAIAKLKANTVLESWMRQGLKLHEGKTICEFCGKPLDEAVVNTIREHFSDEYELLLSRLTTKATAIRDLVFKCTLPDAVKFFPDLRDRYNQYCAELLEWIQWAEGIRDSLSNLLKIKMTSVESIHKYYDVTYRHAWGNRYISLVNALIKQHNNKLSDIEGEKAKARKKLEQHYAAVYYTSENLEKRYAELREHEEVISRANRTIVRISSEIRTLEQKTSQSVIAASKLNELISSLLSGSNITAHAIKGAEFEFRRSNQVAQNLSDGERTAIAFAYFLISLEDSGNDIKDLIVFVDDPVSSLDSNHIYSIYALIINRLMGCEQLFVTTHNSEFFNLIKDEWMDKRAEKAVRKACSAYFVRRHINEDASISGRIENLPVLLRDYKSEYQFVFYHLQSFRTAKAPTLHEIYTSPNLLRKLLESYLGFRMPAGGAWHRKLHLLFKSEDDRKEIAKYADDASHLQNITHAIQHSEYAAGSQRIVAKVLDALQKMDTTHYESLCEALNGATQ